MDDKKLTITLLSGGISAEREVSLKTGTQIAEALRTVGHRVWQSDISPTDLSALDRPCDLIFPALHGTFGEDGQLQEILEARGIPFVGSGSAASRAGMDKAASKSCLLEHRVPTANWQVVYANKFTRGTGLPPGESRSSVTPAPNTATTTGRKPGAAPRLGATTPGASTWSPASGVGYPCVIKPISEGSSVGCKVCVTLEQAREHLAATLPQYGAMLVEQFIEGYELTVGILDGKTLPIIWIKPATPFYDYEAKYTREDTQYLFDIPLPAPVLEAVRRAAEDTHRFLGCRHLSRVDVMVDQRTHDPYVLEVNTMPGFTTHSLVPKAAEKAGIPFTQLCDSLARMALRDARKTEPAA